MSKEKELLIRARDVLRGLKGTHYDLYWDIQTALDQPEQEPVAWMYKQMDCHGEWGTIFKVDKPYISYHDIKDIVPVYTAPPKREPLSDEEIYIRCCAMDSSYTCNFIDGVEWAEQQHGITGGEE
jgi:hypothetical protein